MQNKKKGNKIKKQAKKHKNQGKAANKHSKNGIKYIYIAPAERKV